MKRLFLLIAVCMIGMVLPQGVFAAATVTVSDGTVTINTDKAGDLKAYLQSASDADKAAIRNASSIVFDGKFNKDDLEALKNAECCTQSTVDMAKAKFVKSNSSSGGNTYLFKSDNQMQNKSEGDCCIVGATKYRSGSTNSTDFVWNVADYANGSTLVENENPQRFSSLKEAGDAPHDYNTVILVGGTDYVFRGGQWVSPSQTGGDEEYDYTQMSFSYWGTNVKTAITSNYVLSEDDHLSSGIFSGCTNLENITLGSGVFDFKIGNASEFTKIKSIEVKKDVRQLGSLAQDGDGFFPSSSSLSTLTFEQGGTTPLKFGKNCFNGCSKLTNEELEPKGLLIPARTTLIETMAFGGTGLKTVTFEATTESADPLVIKYQAFMNSKAIRDVYVNVDPKKKALVCEYDAFDFDVLDGQTNPENYEDMATLHFNEGDKEFYKGEWKEGLGFTQTELLAIRGENNQTITIQGLGIGVYYVDDNPKLVNNQNNPVTYSSYTYTQGYLQDKHPANGWQQFAKTGNEIPVLGDFLRSYSTTTPYHMPTYGTSGKPIVKIYRIWDFKDGYTSDDVGHESELNEDTSKKKAYAREIVGHIPNNTGVIMLGITNDKVLYNFKKFEGTVTPFKFTDKGGDADNDNLLVPSNDKTLPIGPTDKSGNEITHRNFGFKVYTKSGKKTGNFLRARPTTTIKPNHAYLKLNKDLFHWRNESGGTGDYNEEIYGATNNSKSMISFVYDLDEDEEFGGIATVIRKAIEEADMEDGEFYTLQGVKVNKPTTKGVYIHNGKKVLVK